MSTASAPGKVILFGEHAVVYGRPAIAAPVNNVAATARLKATPSHNGLRIVAADLAQDYALVNAAPDDPPAQMIRITLAYLKQPPPNATLTISSTIPLGRGLGSGAAISTAVGKALGQFFDQPLPPEQLSELVYEIEKLYHGTPSGIDNTVVAFNQPVYFIKGKPLQRLQVKQPFTLVIGDTGVSAATHKVVGNLRRRRQADPDRYEGYFDEIGVIARHAKMIIQEKVAPVAALGKLMNENQEILSTLGVSSPELETLVTAARRAGAWGAKLSGAGRGGIMIALSPPEPKIIAAITEALTEAGAATVIVSRVGLMPAKTATPSAKE